MAAARMGRHLSRVNANQVSCLFAQTDEKHSRTGVLKLATIDTPGEAYVTSSFRNVGLPLGIALTRTPNKSRHRSALKASPPTRSTLFQKSRRSIPLTLPHQPNSRPFSISEATSTRTRDGRKLRAPSRSV